MLVLPGGAPPSLLIPNGTELVAVLNDNLSIQNVREGDRFTMTIRSPKEYEGATLEGTVVNVHREGRVTGRSEMTLDFDGIRSLRRTASPNCDLAYHLLSPSTYSHAYTSRMNSRWGIPS